MALVKCPECGREKVSDSAIACPDCGFGIREYYTHLKEQQDKAEKEKEYRKHAQSVVQSLDDEIEKHQARRVEILAQKEKEEGEKTNPGMEIGQDYLEKEKLENDREQLRKKIAEQNRVEAARKKQELIIKDLKKKYREFMIVSIVFVIFGIGLIIFMAAFKLFDGMSVIASIIFLLIGLACFSIMEDAKKDLQIAEKNFADYLRVLQQRAAEEAKQKAEEARRRELELMNNVPCPVCGSRNTYKIDNLDRVVSVKIWGMASGKIGKQYQCRDCKHLW